MRCPRLLCGLVSPVGAACPLALARLQVRVNTCPYPHAHRHGRRPGPTDSTQLQALAMTKLHRHACNLRSSAGKAGSQRAEQRWCSASAWQRMAVSVEQPVSQGQRKAVQRGYA